MQGGDNPHPTSVYEAPTARGAKRSQSKKRGRRKHTTCSSKETKKKQPIEVRERQCFSNLLIVKIN